MNSHRKALLHTDAGRKDGEPGSENVGEEEGETPVVIQPPHVDGAFPLHILNNHNEVKIDNQCGRYGMFISDPTFIHP